MTGRISWSSHFIKRYSREICDYYWGILLLSVPCKVFCKAIHNQLMSRIELVLCKDQCGFHPQCGRADRLSTLRILMEKGREFWPTLDICFIILRKAYDSFESTSPLNCSSVLLPHLYIHVLPQIISITQAPHAESMCSYLSVWDDLFCVFNHKSSASRLCAGSHLLQPPPECCY